MDWSRDCPPRASYPRLISFPRFHACLLREVCLDDLPAFFEHQRDSESLRMATFQSREREAFLAHWKKILADPTCLCRTIVADGAVVGNIGAWTDATSHERLLGYWVGREHWGRGIATAAVREFLTLEPTRSLSAHVVTHNVGSIRVLQKCGFAIVAEESFTTPEEGTMVEKVLRIGG